MTESTNLALPYILAAQAQKHVTHNEAIRALDAIVQLSVADRNLTAPPGSPVEGVRYLVPSGATGAWAGQTNRIAAFQDGAWAFYLPRDGWTVWVADENVQIVYDNSAWIAVPGGPGADHGALVGLGDDDHPQYLNNTRGDARYVPIAPTLLGINATADTTNRLALASPASLFNHGGAGHQVKVNKNAAANTASFLFQTGFSGRAEIGTTGDDDFHFKVSSNGSTWNEAIMIEAASGAVSMPLSPYVSGPVSSVDSRIAEFSGTTGRLLKDGGVALTSFAKSLLDDTSASQMLQTLGTRLQLGVIADDAAITIDFGTSTYGILLIAATSASTLRAGVYHLRAASSPALTLIAEGGSAPATGLYTSVLTGTTGTDGAVNLGVDSTGKFSVENRRGSSQTFSGYLFRV